jgi:hypothetical protein
MGNCAELQPMATRKGVRSGLALAANRWRPLLLSWIVAMFVNVAEFAMAAADAPQLDEDELFMEVEALPQAPYVQSRVRYRVRILATVPLRQATLSEPSVGGAMLRRIGDDLRFDVERGGRRYRVLERLYAVIPRQPGPLVITAPRLSAAVPETAVSGQDATEAGRDRVFERLGTVTRTGPTLTLEVRPIPSGAEVPWLAAESISISEKWEPDQARISIGEPITRVLIIEGAGLIGASIPELSDAALDGFRTYPQTRQVDEQISGDDLLASATIRQTFVPTKTGLRQLPAVRLAWWSLGMDEPREASLPARQIWIEAATVGTGDDPAQQARMAFARTAADDVWGQYWIAGLFALAWMVTLVLWLRERRRGKDAAKSSADDRARKTVASPTPDDCAQRFKRACQEQDARAARAALLSWGCATWPRHPPRGPVELVQRLQGDGDALSAAMAIEQGLYARDVAGWNANTGLDCILPLLVQKPRVASSPALLPALYPEAGEELPG